jgi:hypothetical protein
LWVSCSAPWHPRAISKEHHLGLEKPPTWDDKTPSATWCDVLVAEAVQQDNLCAHACDRAVQEQRQSQPTHFLQMVFADRRRYGLADAPMTLVAIIELLPRFVLFCNCMCFILLVACVPGRPSNSK